MSLTAEEEIELLELLELEDREKVAPKLEVFREPAPYKACCGGRGAGAKTTSIASLLVQKMEYGEIHKWLNAREIQESLEESSFAAIWEAVERLEYDGWRKIPTNSKIENTKTGGYFKFMGLKDVKSAKGKKSLQGYDGCWVEECEDITEDVWDILLPTFRKEKAEIWASFNRNKDMDPVYKMFFVNPPPGTITVSLEPGKIDNPWFPDILQRQLEHDYKTRPDIAEHKWGGKPKKQGFNSVLSRVAIRSAMNRNITAPVGQKVCGVDVARFGDDDSELYLRHGMKVKAHESYNGLDNWELADKIWAFIGRDRAVEIVVDGTGNGGGVCDILRKKYQANVREIQFGANPGDKDKYDDFSTELWFEFPVEEADIPNDDDLMDQLSERQYDYLKDGRYKLESKKDFKKRYGKSPDKADGLLLCFYTGSGGNAPQGARSAMARRRGR